MLEDDTVHTHTQSLLLFATEKKGSSCGRPESRRWSVTPVAGDCCPLAPLKMGPGWAGLCGDLWGGPVVTGPAPSSLPVVVSSLRQVESLGGRGHEAEAKGRETFRRPRHPGEHPSVWTGGSDRWPWASDCENACPLSSGPARLSQGTRGPIPPSTPRLALHPPQPSPPPKT